MPHGRTTEGELDHPPTANRIVTLIAVVLPPLGILAVIGALWGVAVRPVDLSPLHLRYSQPRGRPAAQIGDGDGHPAPVFQQRGFGQVPAVVVASLDPDIGPYPVQRRAGGVLAEDGDGVHAAQGS